MKIELRVKYPGMDHYHWRESSATVYERDERGRVLVILGCTINIQERKGQELNLEEAKHKAELADKMKSKYLADMSHEIRTPLNAITGFSELMAFADSDEERREYYEIIKTNNLLLMQLINDILDLSKIEADAIRISYEPVDINGLMDTIFASIKLRMPEGVQLFLEKGSCTCCFGADSIRLLQLINNLANNAIKNTKQGSITLGYTCLPDKCLEFYVKDTGTGIAKDKLESLFTRFVKVNDYVEGIGLGLAICQGLVTKMGGSMHVESELGVGSTFFTDETGREEYDGTEKPEGLVTWVYDGTSFTPVAKVTDGERYTIVHDYLGTPTQAYDSKGELVWEMLLDVYGKVAECHGDRTLVPFRYQGQYEDGETGLYYNRFRYYSPDMGMYISSDPIGLAGNNPTLYGYVQDVNMWLDLWGLNPLGLLTSSMSNPWDTNSSITSIVVPKGGIDIEMAMSPNQTKPGGWGTTDHITNVDFVRNRLAVTPEFKPEISHVQRFHIPEGVRIQVGIVGPQIYNGKIYEGGGNQIQILNYEDRAKLKPIGTPRKISCE